MVRLPLFPTDTPGELENFDEDTQLWEVPSAKLAPVHRILSNLLSADSKDLQKAFKQLRSNSQRGE